MNRRFWDLFGDNYSVNCRKWERSDIPTLPPTGDGWKSRWTANPDFLEVDGRTLLYYRGSGEAGGRPGFHDRIGVAEVLKIGPDLLELRHLNGGDFSVDFGEEG